MDFNRIIDELKHASIFELWRLNCAISNMMDDPTKIGPIRRQLHPGKTVSYFDNRENRLIEAIILEINKTRVFVQNHHDGTRWNIPFYMLNLEEVETCLSTPSSMGSLNKTNLKVGDNVGWISTKNNEEMFGVVVKLNTKKANIRRSNDDIWTVPYRMLFPVLDGVRINNNRTGLLLEGEIITKTSD